jgi:hypothetical protein
MDDVKTIVGVRQRVPAQRRWQECIHELEICQKGSANEDLVVSVATIVGVRTVFLGRRTQRDNGTTGRRTSLAAAATLQCCIGVSGRN